jgi:hypothetical protein
MFHRTGSFACGAHTASGRGSVSTFQLWVIVGVPVLVAVLALLVGGSPLRARIALGLIVALALTFVFVPGAGGPSIAILGLPVMVLVASGRLEGPPRTPHHVGRRRYTTAAGV